MKRVYQAANSVEAHMIVHLLEQAGVEAHVQGEHLQSGAGELPLGLVAVAVPDEDADKARAIINEWEARSTPGCPRAHPEMSDRGRAVSGSRIRHPPWFRRASQAARESLSFTAEAMPLPRPTRLAIAGSGCGRPKRKP